MSQHVNLDPFKIRNSDDIGQMMKYGELKWGNVSEVERRLHGKRAAAEAAASSPYMSSARGSSNSHKKGTRKQRNAYFKARGVREMYKESKRRRAFKRETYKGRMSEFNRRENARRTRKAAERKVRRGE